MSAANGRTAILYVVDGREFGGGERVFEQLVSGLSAFYRIVVAANAGGVFEQRIRRTNADFLGIDLTSRFSFKPVFQIARAIRKYRIDIVHSQGARTDFYCRLGARLVGTPRVLCTVTMPVEGFDVHPLKKKVYRLADKATERYVDGFIVVSEALRRLLVENRGISGRRVACIYNGIELDRYDPGKQNTGSLSIAPAGADEVLVGCFGRLVWQKGIRYLIQAAPTVISKADQVRFVVVGEGPDRTDLEKMAAETGIGERLLFTGFVEDIRPWLSRVDIVAVPSLREGFPMITLEAMAMAKPIVATDIAGIDEQVRHNRSALLVPPRSAAALADAVISLLRNPQLAKELAGEARRTAARKFSVDSMVSATKEMYDYQMTTRNRPRGGGRRR